MTIDIPLFVLIAALVVAFCFVTDMYIHFILFPKRNKKGYERRSTIYVSVGLILLFIELIDCITEFL